MYKPLVSVMVPNYNYGIYLENCLESLYNQTYDNFEVIFRDNRSTDDSYNIALKYREKFLKRGVFCSVSQNKYNLGSNLNSRLCTRDIGGELIYTLASDDAVKAEFIERCVGVFSHNQTIGSVMVHREIVDENGISTQEPSFYNQDCVIPGEEQAAVHMMAGIAIPGQRMINQKANGIVKNFWRSFQVAGDWFENFLFACAADVAYIKDPLCQYRVHSGNETSESELNLLGVFEHYQLINCFKSIADSLGMTKPQERYNEAVYKLGDMCLRYTMKMLKNGYIEPARRYLQLAPVFKNEIVKNEQYIMFTQCLNLSGMDLQDKLKQIESIIPLKRIVSYDPPEGFLPIDKNGRVIK